MYQVDIQTYVDENAIAFITGTKNLEEDFYNGSLVKTTHEKNIVNRVRCLIPEEAA